MSSLPVSTSITGREAPRLISHINRASLSYWEEKRGYRAMPSRRDLEPSEMTAFLPYVFLLDVQHDPLDFRFRLIGTIMDAHMTASYTGRWMSSIPHQAPPSTIWTSCERVVRSQTPLTSETPYVGKYREFKRTEDIIMPLSDDGRFVNMLFVTADFI